MMEKVLGDELCTVVHIEGDSPRSFLNRMFRPDIVPATGVAVREVLDGAVPTHPAKCVHYKDCYDSNDSD